jgi:hypothetical protein
MLDGVVESEKPKREITIFGRVTPWFDDDGDDPSAGVREPRRPAPDDLEAAQELSADQPES